MGKASPERTKVLNFIQNSTRPFSGREVISKTGVCEETVRAYLREMQKDGIIKQISNKGQRKIYMKMGYQLKKLAKAGSPEYLEEYKGLAPSGKQQWLAKFKVDPSCSWLEATSAFKLSKESKSTSIYKPLSPEQLSGPEWLNSKEHVGMLLASGLVKTQPHEHPALAAAGIIQVVTWPTHLRGSIGAFLVVNIVM